MTFQIFTSDVIPLLTCKGLSCPSVETKGFTWGLRDLFDLCPHHLDESPAPSLCPHPLGHLCVSKKLLSGTWHLQFFLGECFLPEVGLAHLLCQVAAPGFSTRCSGPCL